jgi:hypothetical protein
MLRRIEFFVIGTTFPLVPFGIHGNKAVVTLAVAGGDYFALWIIRVDVFIKRVFGADWLPTPRALHIGITLSQDSI